MNHLSHSQVSMWLKCPFQWYCRYILKLKKPPPGPMAFGIAFDDGVTGNYQQKLKTEKDLSIMDTTDIFDESFNKFRDEADWQGANPDDLLETGRGLTKVHMLEEAPTIMPLTVQDKVEIKYNDVYSVVTVSDLVTTTGTIMDWKTTGKSPSKHEDGSYKMSPEHEFQSFIYSLAHRAKHGHDSFDVQFKYHVKNKKPVIRTAKKIVTLAEEGFIVRLYDKVWQSIQLAKEADCFVPNRANMMCSKKQCGFWEDCHAQFGPNLEVANTEKFKIL